MPYKRPIVKTISDRISEPRKFLQILLGPRQTGKTTATTQALETFSRPYLFAEATHNESDADWLRAQWYRARNLITPNHPTALLVVDEVQYVHNWSAVVKTLWDEDTRLGYDLRVLLTGSSSTLLQSGLAESLMGRFELIECPHWFYSECAEAFGYSLQDYLYYGAYPGAATLYPDEARWARYIRSSIVEPSISIDIPLLDDVRKPELVRKLFEVGAVYSAQEVSYRKLLGQLDDRGNTATIAHYLTLLSRAGLMSGLQKYDPKLKRQKASSPRLMVHNTALMSVMYGRKRKELLNDPTAYGHLVESAVGAYLINRSLMENFSVYWWREGNHEVDFVIESEDALTALEVKSGRVKSTTGLDQFVLRYPQAHTLIVGSTKCPLEAFLSGAIELFA